MVHVKTHMQLSEFNSNFHSVFYLSGLLSANGKVLWRGIDRLRTTKEDRGNKSGCDMWGKGNGKLRWRQNVWGKKYLRALCHRENSLKIGSVFSVLEWTQLPQCVQTCMCIKMTCGSAIYLPAPRCKGMISWMYNGPHLTQRWQSNTARY